MNRYSGLAVLRHTLSGNRNWKRVWRSAAPRPEYEAVIIGGGGHGLATAYYLAKNHGIRNIAVLEKGWIGGGNVGRNTTIVRSNYLLCANARFYEWSMKLWENLSHELNYNVMFSQRGVLNLAHTPSQLDAFARRGNAMRLNAIDAELLERDEIAKLVPNLDLSDDTRFPIIGGLFQPRGGTVRHDAVAWGYARAANELGVDIVENCEVTGFSLKDGNVLGVETTRGPIRAKKAGVAVSGYSSQVLGLAGLNNLPLETHVLQAFVSEPIKPILDTVVTSGAGHLYISQSDRGGLVFGGDLEGHNSYAQSGDLPIVKDVMEHAVALFPDFSRLRLLRHWSGIVDMSMDGSPVMGVTPLNGLYVNAGWCYGGFKATPAAGWCFAHTIANDEPHELNASFTLDRFHNGFLIDERGTGPVPGHH
ncbi:MAG: sarcosine oxidase subunit beta family protein [Gammaproteobacteria bacterium]